jgi:hypothetical protein
VFCGLSRTYRAAQKICGKNFITPIFAKIWNKCIGTTRNERKETDLAVLMDSSMTAIHFELNICLPEVSGKLQLAFTLSRTSLTRIANRRRSRGFIATALTPISPDFSLVNLSL